MTMIWEEFGQTALQRPLTREDVLIVAGLANARAGQQFSCEECDCFSPEYLDPENDEHDPPSCCRREANANLKTFPFRRAPARCFVLNFWASEFAYCVADWADAEDSRIDTHPTMKPVGLIERMVRNSSPRGGVVFEPFGGSGSTLIACERLGRSCRSLELDPRFVDVIIERWQTVSGRAVVHESGRLFSDIGKERGRGH